MNNILTIKGWLVLLLMLSILGFGSFVFFNFIFNTEKLAQENPLEETEVLPNETGEFTSFPEKQNLCFEYVEIPTEEFPNSLTENIEIKINGDVVTGKKLGTQSGSELTNGYEGTLLGKRIGDTLELVLSYSVDGADGKELEIYKETEKGLDKQRYKLKDKEENGVLVPDKESKLSIVTYLKVACEKEEAVEVSETPEENTSETSNASEEVTP